MAKRIVVIEDNRDILDLIAYILADLGYEVTGYLHLESMEKILTDQPCLVLLDHKLATGNGSDLCLAIKSDPLTSLIPVILVSASSNIATIAKKCSADGFLSKPFDLEDLIAVVKDHCDTAIH
jgi:two-component system phosphate regulon response regulator PhoB